MAIMEPSVMNKLIDPLKTMESPSAYGHRKVNDGTNLEFNRPENKIDHDNGVEC